jgi:hypothetical protein
MFQSLGENLRRQGSRFAETIVVLVGQQGAGVISYNVSRTEGSNNGRNDHPQNGDKGSDSVTDNQLPAQGIRRSEASALQQSTGHDEDFFKLCYACETMTETLQNWSAAAAAVSDTRDDIEEVGSAYFYFFGGCKRRTRARQQTVSRRFLFFFSTHTQQHVCTE